MTGRGFTAAASRFFRTVQLAAAATAVLLLVVVVAAGWCVGERFVVVWHFLTEESSFEFACPLKERVVDKIHIGRTSVAGRERRARRLGRRGALAYQVRDDLAMVLEWDLQQY